MASSAILIFSPKNISRSEAVVDYILRIITPGTILNSKQTCVNKVLFDLGLDNLPTGIESAVLAYPVWKPGFTTLWTVTRRGHFELPVCSTLVSP